MSDSRSTVSRTSSGGSLASAASANDRQPAAATHRRVRTVSADRPLRGGSPDQGTSDEQPRRRKGRSRTVSGGKTFRSGPPSPTPEERRQLEQSFVLDSVALSMRANAEPNRTGPSMNIGIPQYNAQHDEHAKTYFKSKGVDKTLETTHQANGGSSMLGVVWDEYVAGSHSLYELAERNAQGAGHDFHESVCGHDIPISEPFNGYNGVNGYRRNTWQLRGAPSSFGFQGQPQQPKASVRLTGSLYD
ncbi:sperm microtubule associated protein 1-like [Sycon ciliatum]|uniref:sperm microtubule associated protein 1-like n=1 Tax=Sycon ciliatum TaxID=27933 RepID=UPI0020A97A63|eukprot:scpid66161/ scgid4723/ Uncharacterized protein C17orf98 homolog